jgi:hypothetical protein
LDASFPTIGDEIAGSLAAFHANTDPVRWPSPWVELRVTGVDSYAVVFVQPNVDRPEYNFAISIENGLGQLERPLGNFGTVKYTVKVTREGVLFEAPFVQKDTVSKVDFPAAPSQTAQSESGYMTQSYSNPSILVRFNKNWAP